MALNDVLNRPLFREQALRKGALKPIHAESGRMIGMNVPGGAQNFVQKGQFFLQRTQFPSSPIKGSIVLKVELF